MSAAIPVTNRLGRFGVRFDQAGDPLRAFVVTWTSPLLVPAYTTLESAGETVITVTSSDWLPARFGEMGVHNPALFFDWYTRLDPKYSVDGVTGSIASGGVNSVGSFGLMP